MKQYDINFQGYWRDINKSGIPAKSGIYMVYRCTYNKISDTVGLIDIIYIGQSENVRDRVATHEKHDAFVRQLQHGEELCYAFAPIKESDLDIVERSLIFAQKPILNDDWKDKYGGPDASFKIDGRCLKLKYTDYTITNNNK